MLMEQLAGLGLPDKQAVLTRFKQMLTSSWFRNGDSLSRIYSGTGALKFESKSKVSSRGLLVGVVLCLLPSLYFLSSLLPYPSLLPPSLSPLCLPSPPQLKDGARSVQRTIRSNFMDSNKQEAIDMLLLGNAYSGELGLQCKAFLSKAELLSKCVCVCVANTKGSFPSSYNSENKPRSHYYNQT